MSLERFLRAVRACPITITILPLVGRAFNHLLSLSSGPWTVLEGSPRADCWRGHGSRLASEIFSLNNLKVPRFRRWLAGVAGRAAPCHNRTAAWPVALERPGASCSNPRSRVRSDSHHRMSIRQAYGPGKFALSFELFPPKTPAGEQEMFRHLEHLLAFRPSYVTCTYGAGGSTRDKTLDIVTQVRRRFGVPVASHLTCVGSTVDELRTYLAEAAERGVDHIVALRGDPPRGETNFRPVEGGLRYASELVSLVRREFQPIRHRRGRLSRNPSRGRQSRGRSGEPARKVEAGGDIVITQLFYVNDDFFRFRDRCRQLGIQAPIVPGILPVTNLAQIQRITSMCGARLPAELSRGAGARPKTMPTVSSRPASPSPPGRSKSWSMPAFRAFTFTC